MNNKRIIQLDGLRFIGIFLVMVAHWLQWQISNPIIKNIPFTHGVILFFVLSGFLITRILLTNSEQLQNRHQSRWKIIKAFYVRRFIRIFPIYYILIILLFFLNYENTRKIFIWLATYTVNIFQSTNMFDLKHYNHFWSLAIEEQFYLFWPILILFIKPSKSFYIMIITIALSLMARFYFYHNSQNWMLNSYSSLSNIYALGIGALLAYITLYKKDLTTFLLKPKYSYIGIGAYVIISILQYKLNSAWYKDILDPFLFAWISFIVILHGSNNSYNGIIKFVLENKFIRYSGKISYGLYLFHLFVPDLVYFLIPQTEYFNHKYSFSKYLLFLIYYLITFICAHLSWVIIEKPINNLKHKFPYQELD